MGPAPNLDIPIINQLLHFPYPFLEMALHLCLLIGKLRPMRLNDIFWLPILLFLSYLF